MSDLPPEVLLKIIENLNYKETVMLSGMCKRLNAVTRDNEIWFKFMSRIAYATNIKSIEYLPDVNWFLLFKSVCTGFVAVYKDGRRWRTEWVDEENKLEREVTMLMGPCYRPEKGLLARWLCVLQRDNLKRHIGDYLPVNDSLLDVFMVMAERFGFEYSYQDREPGCDISDIKTSIRNASNNGEALDNALVDYMEENSIKHIACMMQVGKRKRNSGPKMLNREYISPSDVENYKTILQKPRSIDGTSVSPSWTKRPRLASPNP